MWDKDVHFASTHSNQILEYIGEYVKEYPNRTPPVRGYSGWRLCNYLSFVDHSGYMKGLTMYCDAHSIAGMIAHGEVSTLVGHRQGTPIHLSLRQDERIVSLWLRTPHDSRLWPVWMQPTILVCVPSIWMNR